MIRKDVKLGFAIGGVLLAVLVVYVLVGTGGDGKATNGTGAGIVTEDASPSVASRGGGTTPAGSNVHDIPVPPTAGSNDASQGALVKSSADAGASISSPLPPQPELAAGSPSAPSEPRDPNKDLWGKALNEGQLLLSETPTPVGGISARPSSTATGSNPTGPGSVPQGDNTSMSIDDPRARVTDALPAFGDAPATQPVLARTDSSDTHSARSNGTGLVSTARPHVVQKGETLAKIAQVAYGSANFYPHILRANPGLDPMKLKPGMTINLPAAGDVKPAPGQTALAVESARHATSSTAAIDPRTEYRVESGDSLYKIAIKLYGKPLMGDKLYELNKATIGSDRAKLKLNMLLKLPEPPTETAAR